MSGWSKWIGTLYLRGGKDRKGIDCGNLVRIVAKEETGQDLPDFNSPVGTEAIDGTIREHLEKFERLDEPEPFCLVMFNLRPPYTTHIGIVLEDCQHFLHILNNKARVVKEPLDRFIWKGTREGFYRYVG